MLLWSGFHECPPDVTEERLKNEDRLGIEAAKPRTKEFGSTFRVFADSMWDSRTWRDSPPRNAGGHCVKSVPWMTILEAHDLRPLIWPGHAVVNPVEKHIRISLFHV